MRIGNSCVEISGIGRVVIDKTHVWERGDYTITGKDGVERTGDFFMKVAGGEGFTHKKVKSPAAMSRLIHKEIEQRIVRTGVNEYKARHVWFSAPTLNISWREL
jgi:hypothetical protein